MCSAACALENTGTSGLETHHHPTEDPHALQGLQSWSEAAGNAEMLQTCSAVCYHGQRKIPLQQNGGANGVNSQSVGVSGVQFYVTYRDLAA